MLAPRRLWILPLGAALWTPGLWAASAEAGSAACAACHRAIYETYERTPMATTSGEAGRASAESFERASFTHSASGFRYPSAAAAASISSSSKR